MLMKLLINILVALIHLGIVNTLLLILLFEFIMLAKCLIKVLVDYKTALYLFLYNNMTIDLHIFYVKT